METTQQQQQQDQVHRPRALRLIYTDCAGLRRCRVVPLHGDAAAEGQQPLPRIGLTKGCMGQPAYGDTVLPDSGLSATGEAVLAPDPTGHVRALPWFPAHGLALCDLLERTGEPWACCPRSALKRALAALKARRGLDVAAGFEIEFVLLRRVAGGATGDGGGVASGGGLGGSGWAPVDGDIYCMSSSLERCSEVLDAMVTALEAAGVAVVQFHKESAPGQFEIALGPADALTAADRLVLAKETIAAVAMRRGLAVTFVPKPFPQQAGSGCHVHLSLRRDGKTAMVRDAVAPAAGGAAAALQGAATAELSDEASAFFAGVLVHLPAALPFTAPCAAPEWGSYARLRPGCWAGAFCGWGWDNREAPLRATRPGGPETTNFEVKAVDGTANPYLALAALVTAGLAGLEEGAALPPPVAGSPEDGLTVQQQQPQQQQQQHGDGDDSSNAPAAAAAAAAAAATPLPRTLAEALAALEADAAFAAHLGATIGGPLLAAFVAVRRGEMAADMRLGDMLLRY